MNHIIDRLPGWTFGVIALILFIIYDTSHTIFPSVREGEYFEETEKFDKKFSTITIHDNVGCPLCSAAPWFQTKHNKYDVLIKNNATICTECFHPDEAEKLIIIHRLNISELYKRYRAQGSEQLARERILEYNTDSDINEIYW